MTVSFQTLEEWQKNIFSSYFHYFKECPHLTHKGCIYRDKNTPQICRYDNCPQFSKERYEKERVKAWEQFQKTCPRSHDGICVNSLSGYMKTCSYILCPFFKETNLTHKAVKEVEKKTYDDLYWRYLNLVPKCGHRGPEATCLAHTPNKKCNFEVCPQCKAPSKEEPPKDQPIVKGSISKREWITCYCCYRENNRCNYEQNRSWTCDYDLCPYVKEINEGIPMKEKEEPKKPTKEKQLDEQPLFQQHETYRESFKYPHEAKVQTARNIFKLLITTNRFTMNTEIKKWKFEQTTLTCWDLFDQEIHFDIDNETSFCIINVNTDKIMIELQGLKSHEPK